VPSAIIPKFHKPQTRIIVEALTNYKTNHDTTMDMPWSTHIIFLVAGLDGATINYPLICIKNQITIRHNNSFFLLKFVFSTPYMTEEFVCHFKDPFDLISTITPKMFKLIMEQ